MTPRHVCVNSQTKYQIHLKLRRVFKVFLFQLATQWTASSVTPGTMRGATTPGTGHIPRWAISSFNKIPLKTTPGNDASDERV